MRATSARARRPGRSRRAMIFRPCRTKARLTPIEGGDIGDGRKGHEVEERHEVGTLLALLLSAGGWLRRGAGRPPRRRRGGRGRRPRPGGSGSRWPGLGQGLKREVVVEDDDVRPLSAAAMGSWERVPQSTQRMRSWAAARGHRGDVGAVAFVDPVGDVEGCLQPEAAEPDEEEGSGGAAVDIVVGEDGDPFPARRRPGGGGRRRGPCPSG